MPLGVLNTLFYHFHQSGTTYSAVLWPEKELKAFKKIALAPGSSSTVLLNIDVNSLAYFDDGRSKWITEPGEYKIMAASSSKDIRQVATFNIQR